MMLKVGYFGRLHSLQLNVVMYIIYDLEVSGLTFPENVKWLLKCNFMELNERPVQNTLSNKDV